MPHIFLTSKCNLACPYCFASEFVNKDCSEFSLENCLKVIEFIKQSGFKEIGLIGGEPTLYSNLEFVLKTLKHDNQFEKVTLFTNGLEIDKFVDNLTDKKFGLLVNANSPAVLGSKYKKLFENIELLCAKNIDFVLGINIYDKNMDYSYIFDLLKLSGRSELRCSVSLSNEVKENTENILDDFRIIKSTIMSFFNDCLAKEIVPYYDCCSLPDCVLNNEDRCLMATLAKNKHGVNFPLNPVNTCKTCMPVLDIFPDMTVARCFGLSKHSRLPLFKFKSLKMLESSFFNMVDIYARLSYIDEKCENCRFRLYNKCGVCYAYKLDKIDRLKKFCLENV